MGSGDPSSSPWGAPAQAAKAGALASSLAAADKATVEDKTSAAEAPGDIDKIKPVPPNLEVKEETPVAAAAQPAAQTEHLGGQEGELPRDDTQNPSVTPPCPHNAPCPAAGLHYVEPACFLEQARDTLLFIGADAAVQEGPNAEFPSHPQPVENVVGSSSLAAKGNISQGTETGGVSVSEGGGKDFAACLFPSAGLKQSWARVESLFSVQLILLV